MKKAEKKRYGFGVVLGVLLGVGAAGWAQSAFSRTEAGREIEADLRIVVWTHDYAGVGRGTLDRAEKEMTRILEEAGIETAWVDCPVPAIGPGWHPANSEPVGSARIHINIVPRSMEAHYPVTREALGFTSFVKEGVRTSLATVFYDRVKDETQHTTASLAQILAYAIAHELGHLLLRTSGHAPSGIMHARWTPEDLVLVACRELLFTPEQAELMRVEVRARAQESAVAEPSTATASK